jgi:hypothetical protein
MLQAGMFWGPRLICLDFGYLSNSNIVPISRLGFERKIPFPPIRWILMRIEANNGGDQGFVGWKAL